MTHLITFASVFSHPNKVKNGDVHPWSCLQNHTSDSIASLSPFRTKSSTCSKTWALSNWNSQGLPWSPSLTKRHQHRQWPSLGSEELPTKWNPPTNHSMAKYGKQIMQPCREYLGSGRPSPITMLSAGISITFLHVLNTMRICRDGGSLIKSSCQQSHQTVLPF